MEHKTLEIVDELGNAIKRKISLTSFIKKNIGIILGSGISFMALICNLITLIDSRGYIRECSEFYGVDRRYFDANDIMQDKKVTIIALIVFVAYPLLFEYVNKQSTGKCKKMIRIVSFILTTLLLFVQNITFFSVLSEKNHSIISNSLFVLVLIIINFIADVIIAYYLVIKRLLSCNNNANTYQHIILGISLVLYISNVFMGISQIIRNDISDKVKYEMINNNTVVVTVYDGKFLCMDCEIEEKNLNISRAQYKFIDMENVSVTYYEFDKVICE